MPTTSDEWDVTVATKHGQRLETRLVCGPFSRTAAREEQGRLLVPEPFRPHVEINPYVIGGTTCCSKVPDIPTSILALLRAKGKTALNILLGCTTRDARGPARLSRRQSSTNSSLIPQLPQLERLLLDADVSVELEPYLRAVGFRVQLAIRTDADITRLVNSSMGTTTQVCSCLSRQHPTQPLA